MTDLSTIKLFATEPHRCSYLEEQEATTVFVDPNAQMDGELYSQLSEFGFRRSGVHVYRPKCGECRACVPIRIPVDRFAPSRSQLRCVKRNADLQVAMCESVNVEEHYALYEKYIRARHADGDMYPPSISQYHDFLTPVWGITRHMEFRDTQGRLLAVGVGDVLGNGLSAIYTFFDPEQTKRSLGVYSILRQIEWTQEQQLPYVYLGYWIRQCQKMKYKVSYRPFQLLINNSWVSLGNM